MPLAQGTDCKEVWSIVYSTGSEQENQISLSRPGIQLKAGGDASGRIRPLLRRGLALIMAVLIPPPSLSWGRVLPPGWETSAYTERHRGQAFRRRWLSRWGPTLHCHLLKTPASGIW